MKKHASKTGPAEEVSVDKPGAVTPKGQRGFDAPVDRKALQKANLEKLLANKDLHPAIAAILTDSGSRCVPAIEALGAPKPAEAKKGK